MGLEYLLCLILVPVFLGIVLGLCFCLFLETDSFDNIVIKRFYKKYTSGDFEGTMHTLYFFCHTSSYALKKTRIPIREVLGKFDDYFSRCNDKPDDIMTSEYRYVIRHYCQELRLNIAIGLENYLIDNCKGKPTADYLEDALSDEKYDSTLKEYKKEYEKEKEKEKEKEGF